MIVRVARLAAVLAPAVVVLVAALATPLSELSTNQGDVGLYLDRARAVADGLVPYRDVPFEYPPLALVPMLVPYALGPGDALDIERYRWLFAGWEAALVVVLGVVLAGIRGLDDRAEGRRSWTAIRFGVGGRLTVLSIGAALAMAWRFDLFPAVLGMLAIWSGLARRAASAGLALGLGVLAKLYPVVLIPAVAAGWIVGDRQLRPLVTFGLAVILTTMLGLLPFVLVAGPAALGFVGYQVERGLQIESIGGGLAVLTGLVTGSPPALSYGFSAVQVEGPLARALLVVLPLATVFGYGLLAWVGWRRLRAELADDRSGAGVRPATIVTLSFLSLLVLLVTSKVYSIQYVVWIVPFIALLRGPRFWLGAAIVALTMPIHPLLYADLVQQQALPILVLNLRNALLVALTAWLLADVARGGMARPARLELTTFRSAT